MKDYHVTKITKTTFCQHYIVEAEREDLALSRVRRCIFIKDSYNTDTKEEFTLVKEENKDETALEKGRS